ncbi:hypothetical protein M427DRAFT_58491, partial [Gonapodya prolifera JEL478]
MPKSRGFVAFATRENSYKRRSWISWKKTSTPSARTKGSSTGGLSSLCNSPLCPPRSNEEYDLVHLKFYTTPTDFATRWTLCDRQRRRFRLACLRIWNPASRRSRLHHVELLARKVQMRAGEFALKSRVENVISIYRNSFQCIFCNGFFDL